MFAVFSEMMKKQNSRKQRSAKRNVGRPGIVDQQVAISHPPQIQEYAVRHGTRLRFTANANFAGNITYQNLLDTMLTAITAIAGYDQFFAVKVRKVEIWADAVLGTSSTVELAFPSTVAGFVGDQRLHTDASMGIQPAHLSVRPAAKSLAAQFQVSSSNTAFYLNVPAGAVVDCELTFVQASFAMAVAAQNALVGATVGAPYWRGLDGVASAATKLTPAGAAVI